MSGGDGFKGGGEPGEGLNAIELGCFDQRDDGRPALCAFVMACEQGVLAPQRDGADAVLDRIVVDFDPAVPGEKYEAMAQPVVSDV